MINIIELEKVVSDLIKTEYVIGYNDEIGRNIIDANNFEYKKNDINIIIDCKKVKNINNCDILKEVELDIHVLVNNEKSKSNIILQYELDNLNETMKKIDVTDVVISNYNVDSITESEITKDNNHSHKIISISFLLLCSIK